MKKFIVIIKVIISPNTLLYTPAQLAQRVLSNDINYGNLFSHTSIGKNKYFLTA